MRSIFEMGKGFLPVYTLGFQGFFFFFCRLAVMYPETKMTVSNMPFSSVVVLSRQFASHRKPTFPIGKSNEAHKFT